MSAAYRKRIFRRYARPAAVFLAGLTFTFLVCAAFFGFSRSLGQRQAASVRQSVQQAVIHCYALEGRYPPDLAYLQKNYGLILDNSHYVYKYTYFASNLSPQIFVFQKS